MTTGMIILGVLYLAWTIKAAMQLIENWDRIVRPNRYVFGGLFWSGFAIYSWVVIHLIVLIRLGFYLW